MRPVYPQITSSEGLRVELTGFSFLEASASQTVEISIKPKICSRVTIPDEDEPTPPPSVGDARVTPLVGSLAGLLGTILVLGGGYLVRRLVRA